VIYFMLKALREGGAQMLGLKAQRKAALSIGVDRIGCLNHSDLGRHRPWHMGAEALDRTVEHDAERMHCGGTVVNKSLNLRCGYFLGRIGLCCSAGII